MPNLVSYKGAVTDKGSKNTLVQELNFVDYEDVIIPAFNVNRYESQLTQHAQVFISSSKRHFMMDILEPILDVTSYVVDLYGFHGVGDNLQVMNVMTCLEDAITTGNAMTHTVSNGTSLSQSMAYDVSSDEGE